MTTSSPPTWLSVDLGGLPIDLTDGCCYVVWKAEPRVGKPGKWEKAPRRSDTLALASTTDPTTWSTFDDAYMSYQAHPQLTGVGRIMQDDDDITGIDLDDSITPDGHILPWAQEIVDAVPGYWERSPSGTGLRGFARGTLPPGHRQRTYNGASIEIYDDVRHLTLTGQAIVPCVKLPDLSTEIEAAHARWWGDGAAEAGAVLITSAGASDDPGPIGMQILEATCSDDRCAERFLQWWGGDYSAWNGNASAGDWFGANEAAYQLIRLGLDSPNAAADLEPLLRAGPWRPKWDSPRPGKDEHDRPIRTTILGLLIGKALKRQRTRSKSTPQLQFRRAGSDAADDEGPTQPAAPLIETAEQTIARLEHELAEERRAHARTRAENAVQATVIREHNRVEQDLQAEIERLNREKYASYRLQKCSTLTSSQRDTIQAIARVATARANYFETGAPIITGESLGAEIGKCATTARAAADTVCNLPGSPIKRTSTYRQDGTYGKLTTYELAVRDPVEILEQFVVIAESLEPKPSSRRQPPTCDKHPRARLTTLHECSDCQEIVELQPLCAKILCIAPDTTGVDVPVLVPAKNVRIAGPESGPEPDHDARAAALLTVDSGRDVDKWKRIESRTPVDFEAVRRARERAENPEPPDWLREWPDREEPQPPSEPSPDRCVFCPSLVALGNKIACREHERAMADEPWPAAGGGSE
jgi:putative DNA primase/helicase